MPHDWISVRGARVHNLKTSTSIFRATSWWSSPACRVQESRRSPSTPSTPRASAATSSRSPPMPGSSRADGKADVDLIEGLSPAISIEQKTTAPTRAPRSAPSPRSTTTCGCCSPTSRGRTARPAAARSPRSRSSGSFDLVMTYPQDTRLTVMARSCADGRASSRRSCRPGRARFTKGAHRRATALARGGHRARPPQEPQHRIIVDRLIVRSGIERRLAGLGRHGAAAGRRRGDDPVARAGRSLYSRKLACVVCASAFPRCRRAFSFNSPHGACQGPARDWVRTWDFDPRKIVPDDRNRCRRARSCRGPRRRRARGEAIATIARHWGIPATTPFAN